MRRFSNAALIALVTTATIQMATSAWAVVPSDKLLPKTTKGYVSVPDLDKLLKSWDTTQLGKLMADPVMKPFTEDLKQQIRDKLSMSQEKLGISWSDLRRTVGGELSFALIQPERKKPVAAADKKKKVAPVPGVLVLLIDVTGKHAEAKDVLAKVHLDMTKRKATKKTEKVGKTELTIYTLPKKKGEAKPRQAIYFLEDDLLAGGDDLAQVRAILGRLDGKAKGTLADVVAYQTIMTRVNKAAGDLKPHARWFLEPFGYIEAVQAASTAKKKKGKKILPILKSQGFDGIKGLGGYVNMKADRHELLHRSFVYAPGVNGKRGPAKDRLELAARMLTFPNAGDLHPQDFVPGTAASFGSFNLDMKNAFFASETLVDAWIGEEGIWKEIINGLRDDEDGPQIDIRKNLVDQLGQRVTVITSNHQPIEVDSERLVVMLKIKNAKAAKIVAETIAKAMASDPEVKKRVYKGHIIWEIVEEEEEPDLPIVDIDDAGAGLLNLDDDLDVDLDDDEDVEEEERVIRNSAITVAHGHLIIASHIDFLTQVLDKPTDVEGLNVARDYKLVAKELDKISSKTRSFRFFSRTDEEYRVNYELMRKGKMPESETLFGQLLNGMFGDDKSDELRIKKIDASKLPDYQKVRRYLGPAGISITTEDNGWFVTGFTLSKAKP